MTRKELVALRAEESGRSEAVIGMGRETSVKREVDAVFVPFILDGHSDHQTATTSRRMRQRASPGTWVGLVTKCWG